jgi:hypothetical protein
MNQTLTHLIALQEIDSLIIQKRREIEAIPSELKKLERAISSVEERFREVKTKAEAIEKKRRQKEIELQEAIDKIEKLKARTSEIKTNEEYQAHIKEIERAEKKKYLIEDDILYLMEKADELNRNMKQIQSEIQNEKEKITKQQKEIEDRKALLEKEVSDLLKKRNSIISNLDKEVYSIYMNLLEKGNGVAVAEAKDEVCQGCYMSIPPQLYVELKIREELFTCPQCGRFLYRKN